MAVTVTLTGELNSRGKVTINGTEYTTATTVTVENGTEVSVYVSSSTASLQSSCYVMLNGEVVQSGKGTYTFAVTYDAEINIVQKYGTGNYSDKTYYAAEIVMVSPTDPKGKHNTLIDGVSFPIIKGTARMNGVAFNVKKGRTLKDGVGFDVKFASYDPVFANNEWIDIIDACQSGSVPDTWQVGDSKGMLINGTEYQIDIIGKNHDTYADGIYTAPLTFQMHDCYNTKYKMNDSNTNSGGWRDCAMRTTHLPAILALMPSEVQAGIREVIKNTSVGGGSSTINATTDKLFLLSEIEIFGNTSYSTSGEGSQYEYYSVGNSKLKPVAGTTGSWWERSPYRQDKTRFCLVNVSGSANYYTAAFASGVSFAFCF